jgi:5-methylthioadenosine/S-adenosylhomocysteine deaminase
VVRTLIQGGFVVGFDGQSHRIIRDGVVVFEDDTVVHVGASFDGQVDRTIDAAGRLVCPGFINIHCVASIDITHFRLDGQRAGLSRSRAFSVDGVGNLDLTGEDLETSARFCYAAILKGGGTTSVPITAMAPSRWEGPLEQVDVIANAAGELGARAYVSHHYRSGMTYTTEDGGTRSHWDEDAGRAGLERALDAVDRLDGTFDGRIRAMLFPYTLDGCSTELLQATTRAADERGLLVHMHTAQSLGEFHHTLRVHGRTPIRYLHDIGFLGQNVILTHLLYTTANPETGYPIGDMRDVELLADAGVTVAHTPWIWIQNGRVFHSFGRFQRAGVNLAIGTDAFPMDMIHEMRNAVIMGKVADKDSLAVTARDVFNAATLGGAKALGRDDLGRLAPGAKADIVIVDLRGMHVGLMDDPIKTLVYFATQRDIETVIVDGRAVVEDGRIPGIDEHDLMRRANEVNQRQKLAIVAQNPLGTDPEAYFPRPFAVVD